MSICPIYQGASFDCDNPLQPGLEPRVILMNKSDILDYIVVDNKITDIQLSGPAYLFETLTQGINAMHEHSPSALTNGYIHEIQFQIYDISSDQKEELFKMSVGKLAAIVFNMNVPGNEDGYFEVFGIGAGMETTALTRENRGESAAWQITLNTGEATRESKIPYNFFDTDYQTSLDKILDLLAPSAGFPYTLPYTLS